MRRTLTLLFAVMLSAACAGPVGSSPGEQAPDATLGPPAATPTARESTGGAASPQSAPTTTPVAVDPLLALELTDVRSGETFTLGALAMEKPVIVESMAIWCSNCRAQQRQVVEAHGRADFHSVGIDVDPNERAEDLAAYADREGFDWRYVIADAELVRMMTERWGPEVLNPPSMPTFIVADDEIRALQFARLRDADELIVELGG